MRHEFTKRLGLRLRGLHVYEYRLRVWTDPARHPPGGANVERRRVLWHSAPDERDWEPTTTGPA